MYYFNSLLFAKLVNLFGLSQKEVSMRIFGNAYMYARRIEHQDNMLFTDLVNTCNAFRISISSFITNNPENVIYDNRFRYVIPEDKFKPVVFRNENIRWVYGSEGKVKNLTRDQFAADMGVSFTTVSRWVNPDIGGITVDKMLHLCNTYGLSLSIFVDDPNDDIPDVGISEQTGEVAPPRVWQELSDLKNMVKDSKERIEQLANENRQLRYSLKSDSILGEQDRYMTSGGYSPKARPWVPNRTLLENLHAVLNLSQKEFIRAAGMSNFNSSYFDGNITVNALVKICNAFHISTHHFFLRDAGVQPTLHPADYYQSSDWKKVVFHPEYLNDIFGKESLTGMTRQQVEKTLGISEWKIKSWRGPGSPLRVMDLIDLCNTLDVTPSCFITDLNRKELGYSLTQNELLIEENRLLRQQIIRLKEKIKVLRMDAMPSDDEGVTGTAGEGQTDIE